MIVRMSSVRTVVVLIMCAVGCSQPARAQATSDEANAESAEPSAGREPGIMLPQIASFLLPGFDQIWEGEYAAGLTYGGVAIGALSYAGGRYDAARKRLSEDEIKEEEKLGPAGRDRDLRPAAYGMQLYQEMGGLSAYDSFRTATRYRKKLGQFAFLKNQDTMKDVLLAPFHVSFLARETTFFPLAIGLVLNLAAINSIGRDDLQVLRPSDYLFSGLFSYNAGTHEEAVFRGWLMPVLRHYTGDDLWSNLIGSSLFAVAHLNTVSVPIAQLLLGYHLGYVTQKNGWSISESIFIHTWWDVMAFISMYMTPREDLLGARQRLPFLLPPIEFHF